MNNWRTVPLLILIASVFLPGQAGAMVFKPKKGAIWDPSIIWHDGMYLDETHNTGQGLVLEGKSKSRTSASGDADRPTAGFVIGDKASQGRVVQLGIGKPEARETSICRLVTGPGGADTFTSEHAAAKVCATVTGAEEGKEHSFRLLCRMELFELYLDDLLAQTHTCAAGSGKIGFPTANAMAEVTDLRAWTMSSPK